MFSLSDRWHNLLVGCGDTSLVADFWQQLVEAYQHASRHYHTLDHLAYMFEQLSPHREAIDNWEALAFAVFYHDIVYDAKGQDNEAQSAAVMKRQLKELGVAEATIQLCESHILATKNHKAGVSEDTLYILDADLAVLGDSREVYAEYTEQIRREYKMYPMFLYKKGRKKVLRHFLAMDRIYKTEPFYQEREQQARENLLWELGGKR